MTITSMAALQAALPGRLIAQGGNAAPSWASGAFTSLWTPLGGGTPAPAGAVPTPATAGAIPTTAPSGANTLYAARLRGFAQNANGPLVLLDRLVHTSGLNGTLTSLQTVNSPAVNRPDNTGTDAHPYLEIYSSTNFNATNVTISYTNQSGVSGQVATTVLGSQNYYTGLLLPLVLAAGDTGVRSVESLTLSASMGAAGNFGITIARQLAWVPLAGNYVASSQDHFELGLPVITNACLFLAGMNLGGNWKGYELTTVEG